MTIIEIKAAIFDIILEQELLQQKINSLSKPKNDLLDELAKAEIKEVKTKSISHP